MRAEGDAALERAAGHAREYLADLEEAPVAPTASREELRARLAAPLPESGTEPEQVVDELVAAVGDGLLGSAGGRFYGWVVGGSLPAAVAADWLASAWDQNAAIYATSPAAAVVEEVCGEWLKELLQLPRDAAFAIVTGCQMAHATALAAARHQVLADRGLDVERHGLAGAPPIRVLASELRHATIDRALRLLGIGTGAIAEVPAGDDARIRVDALGEALAAGGDAPTIVCLQAGELNTGACDDFAAACALAREHGAWVHVDGAFGLWARACTAKRPLVEGLELADSWATDGHKWLNVPYDAGFAFVARPGAQRAGFTVSTSYYVAGGNGRDPSDWNPEWSRRARCFAIYAAIRSLGRAGVDELVLRCCRLAGDLVSGIGALPGAEVVAAPVLNQGLVRFTEGGDGDRRTDEVIERVRDGGEAWFGGVTWRGRRAMRVSVSSWRTDDRDVERAIGAVATALAAS